MAAKALKPQVPQPAGFSWFQPIIGNPGGIKFSGDGVPLDSTMPKEGRHGYWIQRARTVNGKKLQPAYFFYYTGSGPRDKLEWGEEQDYVQWVKADGANTKKKFKVVLRAPSDGTALTTRFAPNNGPEKGFVIRRGSQPGSPIVSGNNTPKSKSGVTTPKGDTTQHKMSQQDFLQQLVLKLTDAKVGQPVKIDKKKVTELTKKSYPKRVLAGGKSVSDVFGPRKEGRGGNFGDVDFDRRGTSDPRYALAMSLVPGPQACLFGSQIDYDEQEDGELHVHFQFTTIVKKDNPDLPAIKQMLDENCAAANWANPAKKKVAPLPEKAKEQRQRKERRVPKTADEELQERLQEANEKEGDASFMAHVFDN